MTELEIAEYLTKIANHARDFMNDEDDQIYWLIALEDTLDRIEVLSAKLRGVKRRPARYAYPMEGEE